MKRGVQHQPGNFLSYADYGDPNGFPILIHHGLIASIQDEPMFDRLVQTGARLIAIARPGYGDSSPVAMQQIGEWGQVVAFLVNALGLAQFDVFGISSGAPYSYAVGHTLPHQVRNIYILSGTPALYDANVQRHWPFPVQQNASMAEMQALAYALFFSNLPVEDLQNDAIQDSMMNHCYGVAQDLRLRCVDWGFQLAQLPARVIMRHSRADSAVPFITAELTAQMIPNCRLDVRQHDVHFTQAVLDDFIRTEIAPVFRS